MWRSGNTRQQIEAFESRLQLPETRLIISTINPIPQNRRIKQSSALFALLTQKRGGREASPFFNSGARLGAVHRSAAPWPPTGWPRSTLGAMGLSFRVRNGTGRAPHALAADRWAAPTVTVSGVSPRALGAAWRIGEVTRGHPRARTALSSACPAGREVRFRKSSGD